MSMYRCSLPSTKSDEFVIFNAVVVMVARKGHLIPFKASSYTSFKQSIQESCYTIGLAPKVS